MPRNDVSETDLIHIALYAFNQQTIKQKGQGVGYHDSEVQDAYDAWQAYLDGNQKNISQDLIRSISECVKFGRSGFAELQRALNITEETRAQNHQKPKL